MADDGLGVLGDLHVVDAKMDRHVGEVLGLAAGIGDHRIAPHANPACLLQRAQDVGRVAGAGKREQYVAIAGLDRELVGEDILVALVVGEARQDGRVGGQRLDADARALLLRQR